MNIVIATSNSGKFAEFAEFLKETGLSLTSLSDYPTIPAIAETGLTFMDNALIKAREAAKCTGLPSLADDSGLEVNALGGMPGVYSARFGPSAESRNRKLLDLMQHVTDENRTARFVCALAFVRPDGFTWTTLGVCHGSIIKESRGNEGFGYDPIFFYESLGVTFAEIPQTTKNKISHRGIALDHFITALKEGKLLPRF